MIYSLRKKFIKVSILSVTAVLLVIYIVIGCINVRQMNRRADTFTDVIAENGGRFPKWEKIHERPGDINRIKGFMNPDSEVSTRFFGVWTDKNREIVRVDTESISSVTEAQAKEYATKVIAREKERGWISYYRYRVCETEFGWFIVFVDEHTSRNMTINFMLILGLVFIGSILGILTLIIVFSKKVVKPIAESYDKQKQFITDANHELKTPLTLILTNLEILEAEYGKSEWVEDMRAEGMRMTELVNQLVALSRMDEDGEQMQKQLFPMSDLLLELLSEYQNLADVRQKNLHIDIEPNLEYCGDQKAIRQLLAILLDNALKYCDSEGDIRVSLIKRRDIEIRIENTFGDVKNTKLDRLFDRFYRSDRARTADGSFGIGLSIAKAIVEKHKGEIKAYEAAEDRIGFEVLLKM